MCTGEVPDQSSPSGTSTYVFAAGITGVFSLPAPQRGLPFSDFWTGFNLPPPPSLPVQYTGAPAFVNVPGAIALNGFPTVRSHLYAGGAFTSPAFGGQFTGKV